MSTPEDAVAQAVRELVVSGAVEPWQFSPAEARRAARLRWKPFSAPHGRYRRPRTPAVRVATAFLVAALIVAVFVAPWPPLHLFGSGPHAAVGPYSSLPVIATSGTSACRSGSATSTATAANGDLPLAAVQFVSSEKGWVVGAGRILATDDGGKNWRVQYQGPAQFFDVDFVDADHGFAVGTNHLMATDDGGRQWSELKEPCLAINSVYFTSPNVGYAMAGGALQYGETTPLQGGKLLVTSDAGHHWRLDTKAPPSVQSACFTSQDDGWIGTPGKVWRTTDDGLHWSLSFAEPPRSGSTPQQGDDPAAVQCGGAQGAWVLFLGSGAAMSHSPYVAFATRTGHLWHPVLEERFTESGIMPEVHAPEGPGSYPGPFSAVNADTAIFVGFSPPAPVPTSFEIATHNGTELSSDRAVTGLFEPTAVAFVNDKEGWVIGIASGNKGSAIEATSDGGRTWARQWSSSRSLASSPRTQKAVAVSATRYPALSSSILNALVGLMPDGRAPIPVPPSRISHAITDKKAVEIAASSAFGKGARIVAVGLVTLAASADNSTTAWLVLIDPPGAHKCISYGPTPASPSCRLNVYAVPVDALSGNVLWSGTLNSPALGVLPVFGTTERASLATRPRTGG